MTNMDALRRFFIGFCITLGVIFLIFAGVVGYSLIKVGRASDSANRSLILVAQTSYQNCHDSQKALRETTVVSDQDLALNIRLYHKLKFDQEVINEIVSEIHKRNKVNRAKYTVRHCLARPFIVEAIKKYGRKAVINAEGPP